MGSKSVIFILWLLILFLANGRISGAVALPSPEVKDVQAVALASDGNRLIIFYCSFAPNINERKGFMWEWTGSAWDPLFGSGSISPGETPGFECNNPDLAVSGTTVAGTHNDDTGDLRTIVLHNGLQQAFSGCSGCNLTHGLDEKNPRVGFAFGKPFAVYDKFNGGLIQDRLFIDDLTSVGHTSNELLGGNVVHNGLPVSVSNPTIVGFTNDYWVAYRTNISGSCWGVRDSSSNSLLSTHIGGSCFHNNDGGPRAVLGPEIFAWQGTFPGIVSRQRDTGSNMERIHINIFKSGIWPSVKQNLPKVDNGLIGRLRAKANGSTLYIAYKRVADNEIIVEQHEISDGGATFNSNVTRMTVSLSPSQLASTFDLTVFQGQPYLAYLDNGKLKVESLVVSGPPTGQTFSLNVLKSGSSGGLVTSVPSGIVCGTGCQSSFPADTTVVLTALPETGSTFSGWSGGGCSGTGTCTVVLTSNVTVTGTFTAQTFNDVPTNHFAVEFIETFFAEGITSGCGNNNYCPEDPVTRAQMAIFVERGIQGSSFVPPAATGTVFNDVTVADFGAAFIEQFFRDGISAGCGNGNYCPDDSVTRAQMAIFLERAMRGSGFVPPAATGNVFNDVTTADFGAAFIEEFFRDGITTGCGNGNYCPDDSVTRARKWRFLSSGPSTWVERVASSPSTWVERVASSPLARTSVPTVAWPQKVKSSMRAVPVTNSL